MDLKSPGTYLLILKVERSLCGIKIGRTLQFDLKEGFYGYVGSALGRGGLISRLKRHASSNKRNHWHIDYLLNQARLLGAVVKADKAHLECSWSVCIGQMANASIDKFGASDCSCNSHLFYFDDRERIDLLVERLEIKLEGNFVDVIHLRH